ncbi:MAG: polysaccharide biosynthesis tyrosine autokinase [Pelolinea sp.]|nr:polysaccharide biosynthesis tyrosine autokinase [Pelolinea sp.]
MEIKQFVDLLQRWVWLLIIGLILGTAGGYFGSSYQTPVYQSSTRVLVLRAPQQEKASDVTYLSDQQLSQTYIQLATTQPVLDAVSERINYTVNSKNITVQQVRDTQVIQVIVEDTDPNRAALIANTLVEVLIEQNDIIQAGRYASVEDSMSAQIDQVEKQISAIQDQINQTSTQSLQDQITLVETQIGDLQAQIANLNSKWSKTSEDKAQIVQLGSILDLYQEVYTNLVVLGLPSATAYEGQNYPLEQLQSTLTLYQNIYTNLLQSYESVRLARLQTTPNITQIEPAIESKIPVRPRVMMNTLLAALVGLSLTGGIVFLIEFLDDTIKTPEDVMRLLNLPVIGYFPEIQRNGNREDELVVAKQPRSPVSEAFRSLRTNLEYSEVDKPLKVILVTSSGPSEGKSLIAANLAVVFAQGGKRVLIMDGDLRKPALHLYFGVPNRLGLSDLFRGQSIQEVAHVWKSNKLVAVVTSGSLPPNPSELLGSEKMDQILEQLRLMADIIIIDSPPCMFTDAQVLSSKVDGILITIYPGHTHRDNAKAAVEQLERTDARILGIVFNRIPRNRTYYYGGYRHYSSYNYRDYHYYSESDTEDTKKQNTPVKKDGKHPRREKNQESPSSSEM